MTAEAAQFERITIFLIPKAGDDLRRLQERTNLSRTDLANRAITLYEFVDAQLRAGNEMITRHSQTGKTKLVKLIDAPAGQAVQAGPALAGRGQAARHRRPGRLGRLRRQLHLRDGAPGLQPVSGLTAQR